MIHCQRVTFGFGHSQKDEKKIRKEVLPYFTKHRLILRREDTGSLTWIALALSLRHEARTMPRTVTLGAICTEERSGTFAPVLYADTTVLAETR